jgi:hypothetical protein
MGGRWNRRIRAEEEAETETEAGRDILVQYRVIRAECDILIERRDESLRPGMCIYSTYVLLRVTSMFTRWTRSGERRHCLRLQITATAYSIQPTV